LEKLLALIGKNRRIAYPLVGLIALLALSAGVTAATGTLSGTTATSPAATAQTSSAPAGGNGAGGFPAAGGADNIVQVINHTDSSLKSDGKDQLNSIPGPNVGPKNEALAYSTCTNCQTYALAVQLDLTGPSPRNVQPFNFAKAENFGTTGTVTCAIAVQFVLAVTDPTAIPSNVRREEAQLHSQLSNLPAAITSAGYTLDCHKDAPNGIYAYAINVIVQQLQALGGSVDVKQDVATAPTTPGSTSVPASPPSSPTSASPTVSGSPTESPTPQPTPSGSP
jgi:hypothetical protein